VAPQPGETTLHDLAPGGGFVFGSVHIIQASVPPENIAATFDTARGVGGYPIRVSRRALGRRGACHARRVISSDCRDSPRDVLGSRPWVGHHLPQQELKTDGGEIKHLWVKGVRWFPMRTHVRQMHEERRLDPDQEGRRRRVWRRCRRATRGMRPALAAGRCFRLGRAGTALWRS